MSCEIYFFFFFQFRNRIHTWMSKVPRKLFCFVKSISLKICSFHGAYFKSGIAQTFRTLHIAKEANKTLRMSNQHSAVQFLKCLSHRKPCKIQKNVTKLISVRTKSYSFSKYLMPSILKYIIHISYIFSFLL